MSYNQHLTLLTRNGGHGRKRIDKLIYLIELFADTAEALNALLKKLIASAIDGLARPVPAAPQRSD